MVDKTIISFQQRVTELAVRCKIEAEYCYQTFVQIDSEMFLLFRSGQDPDDTTGRP